MTAEKKNFRLKECFLSVQGEGVNTGRPAVFVRFSGCNLSCEFCDTDHSGGIMVSRQSIIDKVSETARGNGDPLIVLTGGEPMLQPDIVGLVEDLYDNHEVAIETNGTRSLTEVAGLAHCSVSPKTRESANPNALAFADEFKIVVPASAELFATESLMKYCLEFVKREEPVIWLQPESNDPSAVDRCVWLANHYGKPFRVGHQLHVIRRWK